MYYLCHICITYVLCSSEMRLLALCLTKHKKARKLYDFSAFLFLMISVWKRILNQYFIKSNIVEEIILILMNVFFFVFYFKISRNKLILKKDIFLNVKYSLKLKKKLFKKKKFWLNVILKENRKKKNEVIIFFLWKKTVQKIFV